MNREQARQRATELVDQMDLSEMISQLRYDAPAIERLNIPEYKASTELQEPARPPAFPSPSDLARHLIKSS